MTGYPDSFRTFHDPMGALHWRLLASNGRTLGISLPTYPDQEAAWTGLLAVAAIATSLTPSYNHPRSQLGWLWTAADGDGNAVARGGRAYERRATCVMGFDRFCANLRSLLDEL